MEERHRQLLSDLESVLDAYDIKEFVVVFTKDDRTSALGTGRKGGIIDNLQAMCKLLSAMYTDALDYALERSREEYESAMKKMKEKYDIHEEITNILKEESE